MIISPLDLEIERIYYTLVQHKCKSVAFTSTAPKQGVTSIAATLSHRALLAGKSSLLVDLNLIHPNLISHGIKNILPHLENNHISSKSIEDQNVSKTADEMIPELISVAPYNISLNGVIAPHSLEMIINLRRPEVLEKYIKKWEQDYDLIVFDTSPLSFDNDKNTICAERVALSCDGAILVVMAGETIEPKVEEVVKKFKYANVNLLGCIINDKNYPSLKNEMLREINRLEKHFPSMARWLKNRVLKSHLLSLEI